MTSGRFSAARVGCLIVAAFVVLISTNCGAFSSPTAPPTSAAVINVFSADTNPVPTGTPTVLRWDVSGADTVRIDPNVGSVATSGNRTLILTATTTFTLSAVDSHGLTAQGQLTVVVK